MTKSIRHAVQWLCFLTVAIATISVSQAGTPCEVGISAYIKKHVHSGTHFALATTGGRSLAAAGTDCDIRLGATQELSKATAIKQCGKISKAHHHSEGCRVIQSQ